MDYTEIHRRELLSTKEAILRRFESRMSFIDYFVAKNTVNKLIDEEIADFELFEKTILKNDFIGDMSSSDKIAFTLRGTMHIERVLEKILDFLGKKHKGKKLWQKIDILKKSNIRASNLTEALTAVRHYRNPPAHELEKGRIVTVEEAQKIYSALGSETQRRIRNELEPDPLALTPEDLVKLSMVVILTELETELMIMKWTAQLADILLPANTPRPY